MKCRYFLVSGQVQGVGYRAFVQRQATALDLTGQVRNLRDGRVEALAKGAGAALDQLHEKLLEGPRLAQVTALAVKEIAEDRLFEGFLIVEDGQRPWFEVSPS
ncbi:MAG: acylphosphatase [Bdellovibrionales bacterium]